MTKSDLIDALASDINLSSYKAKSVINIIIETMADALCRGESVEIRGFGSFVIRHYDSYEGRHPRTKKKIQVQSKKLPFFKVGKELREKVDAVGKG